MKSFFGKFITDRKIVIISDHKVKSLHVSARLQYITLAILLLFTAWLPFSLGRSAAFDDITYENAQIIDGAKGVEGRLNLMERNINVLEHYINKLYKDGKFFIEDESEESADTNSSKVRELEKRKNKIIAYLASFTEEKTDAIEGILAESGVNYSKILKDKRSSGQGGPYIPAGTAALGATPEESLQNYTHYFNNSFIQDFEYLIGLQDIVSQLPFSSPVQVPRVTSKYGYRRDPINGGSAMHSGIDLVGRKNAAIHSTAPGVVTFSGRQRGYGNLVTIKHKNGLETRYAHLRRIYVKKGQRVERGNVIGVQGNTGRSTGAHLHYEVRINGKAVNPMRFLRHADKVQFYEVKL